VSYFSIIFSIFLLIFLYFYIFLATAQTPFFKLLHRLPFLLCLLFSAGSTDHSSFLAIYELVPGLCSLFFSAAFLDVSLFSSADGLVVRALPLFCCFSLDWRRCRVLSVQAVLRLHGRRRSSWALLTCWCSRCRKNTLNCFCFRRVLFVFPAL